MPEPRRTVKASEIVADIRAGMSDAILMKKYAVSENTLRSILKKLSDAGLLGKRTEGIGRRPVPRRPASRSAAEERIGAACPLPPEHEGPIPDTEALVPLTKEQNQALEQTKREADRLKRELRAQERILFIADSRTHIWLIAFGLLALALGGGMLFLWPILAPTWYADLAFERALNLDGPIHQNFRFWNEFCMTAGPLGALAGVALVVVGIGKWWRKEKRLDRLAQSRSPEPEPEPQDR